jgi:hypothetical protein
MTTTNRCLYCSAELVQRRGERADKFARRMTCNVTCARRHQGRTGVNNRRSPDREDWWRPLGSDPFVHYREATLSQDRAGMKRSKER